MDELNILAGPILRRTEQSRACIWLVTNKEIDITGILYQESNNSLLEIANSRANNGHQQIQVSDSCFVHLIQITSLEGLPTDTRLFYDIYFGEPDKGINLNALGLIKTHYDNPSDDGYLNLNGLPLPSFYIPTTLKRYLHGSCFKLHGDGQESFSKGEQLLQDSVDSPISKRPACLFLTGDQIYADDVSNTTIKQLTQFISNTLKTNEGQAPWLADIKPQLAVGERVSLFRKRSHARFRKGERIGYRYTKTFTSGAADNHLVSFSEFFGLHLLCWNPTNWDDSVYSNIGISGHRIRRLLANTPTYMMFDDHDITDDWNINQAWQSTVQQDNLTRKVVSNGLAAYFLCQGWGNNPEAFDSAFISTVQDYLHNLSAPTPLQNESFETTLWNFHQWHFSVPTSPAIIALDTRTNRRHRGNNKVSGLINNAGFAAIQPLWIEANKPSEIILVSPSPVLGQEFLEWIQQLMTKVGKISSVDAEFWRGDKPTFNQLMHTLNNTFKLKRCIILSGDVHHSYAFKGRLKHSAGETILQQFTCSALRNRSPAWDIIYSQKKLDTANYGVPRSSMQGFHLKQKGKKKLGDEFGVIRTLPLTSNLKLDIEPITSDTGLAVITHNSIGEIHDKGATISQTTHGALSTLLTGKYTMTSN
ncbi:metallophosphoesterase family protein [Alkalimarinus alittae]|uniref:PhoD-like phosphatase metallophosphatase domain-containing protein n=1 Tax=Alkalimarinus alittae TaxID=2961619 RepID=A0ABY6N6E0_9ALTE|nr:hypothetical protein [Alkalimarinus alittae]UZE97649.1 hypothetical protein NKI27_07920 [Alkalimarinus alittae]